LILFLDMKERIPIWIIGYMGSGKSTVGQLLADRLGCAFTDSDHQIEQESGRSIPELFAGEGEAAFRKRELQFVEGISPDKQVVSCGGGLPCFHNLMERLLSMGRVVYLQASVETLTERLLNAGTGGRPLLGDVGHEALPEVVRKGLEARKRVYEQADIVLSVDGKTPEFIVEELLAQL
jgi:shikimate kinase